MLKSSTKGPEEGVSAALYAAPTTGDSSGAQEPADGRSKCPSPVLITCRLRPVVSCRVDAALLPPVPFYTPVGRAALRVGRQASICAATPFAIINAVNRQVQLVGDCSAALDAVQLHAAAATPTAGRVALSPHVGAEHARYPACSAQFSRIRWWRWARWCRAGCRQR